MNIIKSLILSSAAIIGTASAALAQSETAQIQFKSGDNSGALAIAQAAYGQTQTMETAVLDLDGDQTAEIAVRFPDNCDEYGCTTTLLYSSNNTWVELFQENVSELRVGAPGSNGLKAIHADDVKWSWMNNRYQPWIDGVEWAAMEGEESFLLSEIEKKDPKVARIIDLTKFEFDLLGDGKAESIVGSLSIVDCGSLNICPVTIFAKDGERIFHGYAREGMVGKYQEDVVRLIPHGLEVLSYDGSSLSSKRKIVAKPVVRRQ